MKYTFGVYAQRDPEKSLTQPQVFEKLKKRFQMTGSVTYEKHVRVKPATHDENKMIVALCVVLTPQNGTRQPLRELPVGPGL